MQDKLDEERLIILREGFQTEFWKLLTQVLIVWKNDKAHRIAGNTELKDKAIGIEQGYYKCLNDMINLPKSIKYKKGVNK